MVIAGALSYNGGDPSTVRVTNVQSNSFQIQIQEWAYLDTWHTTETISWMVVEAGCYNPTGDNGYCAGVVPEVKEQFKKINFAEKMRDPVVFSQLTSMNNPNVPLVLRQKGVNKKKFHVRIQAEEAQRHNGGEQVHYICLLYTSPSPRDATLSRMPSSA